jgi:hypothetical protein
MNNLKTGIMKRSDFLKSFLGVIAISAISNHSQAIETEDEFLFDELFHKPYNNNRLFYPKPNTSIYNKIKESIGEKRILECRCFHHYLGVNDVIIPIKEKYKFSDFMPFVFCLKSYYKRHDFFSETEQGSFFRMIDDEDNTMHFDLFVGVEKRLFQ